MMTQDETIITLSGMTGLTQKDVRSLLEAQAQLAYKNARHGAVIMGIGKPVAKRVASRMMKARFGDNAGEMVKIPAKTKVQFRLCKAVRDALNE